MPFLSEADRPSLLALARRAIVEAVSHEKPPGDIPKSCAFTEKCGVFVTLHAHGRLRGCIGVIEAFEPLGDSVARCASSAATQDPRFSAVRTDELQGLRIEISLLSPLEPILPENIEIGKHGLLISEGMKRGLLLPQVAVDHHLSRERFLQETCRKARLNLDAWRAPETKILGFTCEIFSEGANVTEQRDAKS